MTKFLIGLMCLLSCGAHRLNANELTRDAVACTDGSRPRVMTDPTGTFTSANYPADYSNNADCQWLIVAQDGQIVNLDFESFATERGYDRVWIYDGTTTASPVIVGLDGLRSTPPTSIHSTQQNMLVSFTSDVSNTAAGFSATYTSIDPVGIEDACSAVFRPLVLTGDSGTFTSQFYPEPYPFGCRCQWKIISTGGFVKLDFSSFFTEPNNDWVAIYDGDSSASPLIARLGGAYSPPPSGFQTTQSTMFVQFDSDLSGSVRGFNATYTSVPAQ